MKARPARSRVPSVAGVVGGVPSAPRRSHSRNYGPTVRVSGSWLVRVAEEMLGAVLSLRSKLLVPVLVFAPCLWARGGVRAGKKARRKARSRAGTRWSARKLWQPEGSAAHEEHPTTGRSPPLMSAFRIFPWCPRVGHPPAGPGAARCRPAPHHERWRRGRRAPRCRRRGAAPTPATVQSTCSIFGEAGERGRCQVGEGRERGVLSRPTARSAARAARSRLSVSSCRTICSLWAAPHRLADGELALTHRGARARSRLGHVGARDFYHSARQDHERGHAFHDATCEIRVGQ